LPTNSPTEDPTVDPTAGPTFEEISGGIKKGNMWRWFAGILAAIAVLLLGVALSKYYCPLAPKDVKCESQYTRKAVAQTKG